MTLNELIERVRTDNPNALAKVDDRVAARVLRAALAAIVGANPLPRTEVTKQVWAYIKKHNLQDAVNRRMINADAKLKEIFKKAQASMFEMTKMINDHLK